MSGGPLEGLLVVSMDQAVAAPYASSRMAEAGARVIKVEREGGDFARGYDEAAQGESSYFVWLNRGKESIVLDIKKSEDADLLHAMIAKADVFIQNLVPGAAERAGFGSADLRARYPRLITCDVSGYGEEGPYRDMKAYDLLIQAETGLAAITGSPEQPGRVGVSIVDLAAGMQAFNGILQMLIQRGRTGKGGGISVSLFDAMADLMTVPFLHQEQTGKAPKRVGMNHPSIAPYGAYRCSDGKEVVISIQNEREWKRLCEEVLGDASLAQDERFRNNVVRVANRPALNAIIDGVFGALTRDEVTAMLAKAKVAFGALNSVEDLTRHVQLRRVTVETPAGPISMPAPPVIQTDGAVPRGPIAGINPGRVPRTGEHTEALRAEFAPGKA